MFEFLKKKKQPIKMGISEAEYRECLAELTAAYNEAVARQKEGTTKPSGYMKGLRKATEILACYAPHAL